MSGVTEAKREAEELEESKGIDDGNLGYVCGLGNVGRSHRHLEITHM